MNLERCPLGSKCPAEQRLHEIAQAVIARGNGSVPERESFWLVERKTSPPAWVGGSAGFTLDAWHARRFCNERAAHDYWRTMAQRDECFVSEHMFLNKTAS